MRRIRVIPVLQIENNKLVKTSRFKSPAYIGDPLNALRIFNDKLVDEVMVLDIGATRNRKSPDIGFIQQLASECFMPMSYGGGITTIEQASRIFQSGIEKVVIGTSFFRDPDLVTRIADKFGSQSVMVSVDVKKNWTGSEKTYVECGTTNTRYSALDYSVLAQRKGAGELLLQCIEKEGTGEGYDLNLIKRISAAVNIPVVSVGGANSLQDFFNAIQQGASAVAAGNLFVYKGIHKAVLINYPDQKTLVEQLYNKIS